MPELVAPEVHDIQRNVSIEDVLTVVVENDPLSPKSFTVLEALLSADTSIQSLVLIILFFYLVNRVMLNIRRTD